MGSVKKHESTKMNYYLKDYAPDLSIIPKGFRLHSTTVVSIIELKKPLPSKQFRSKDLLQAYNYASCILDEQPWCEHVTYAISDGLSISFYRLYQAECCLEAIESLNLNDSKGLHFLSAFLSASTMDHSFALPQLQNVFNTHTNLMISRYLGSGVTSYVYEAEDPKNNKFVAKIFQDVNYYDNDEYFILSDLGNNGVKWIPKCIEHTPQGLLMTPVGNLALNSDLILNTKMIYQIAECLEGAHKCGY